MIQEIEYVKEDDKLEYMLNCLQKTAPPVLIFAQNKKDVDAIHEHLLVQVRKKFEKAWQVVLASMHGHPQKHHLGGEFTVGNHQCVEESVAFCLVADWSVSMSQRTAQPNAFGRCMFGEWQFVLSLPEVSTVIAITIAIPET